LYVYPDDRVITDPVQHEINGYNNYSSNHRVYSEVVRCGKLNMEHLSNLAWTYKNQWISLSSTCRELIITIIVVVVLLFLFFFLLLLLLIIIINLCQNIKKLNRKTMTKCMQKTSEHEHQPCKTVLMSYN